MQTYAVRTVLVLQSVNEVPLEPGSVGVFTRDHLSRVVFSGVVDEANGVTQALVVDP